MTGQEGSKRRMGSTSQIAAAGKSARARRRLQGAALFAVQQLESRVFLTVAAPSLLVANFTAAPGDTVSAMLTWRDNSINETGFKIERSTDGTNFTQIAVAGANTGPFAAYNDTSASNGVAYTYRLKATNADGNGGAGEDSSYAPVATATGWTSAELGTSTGGSYSVSSGTVTLNSKGQLIGGTSDDGRFAYRSISGDGTIIARVAGVQYTSSIAMGGVMFRNTLAANSKEAFMAITAGSGAEFTVRSSDGGNADMRGYSGYSAPCWVKLVRAGTSFTGYVSSNGTTWTLVRSVNVVMNQTIYVGLALSSSGYGSYNTSTLDNVNVTWKDSALPSGWSDQEVGTSSGIAGSARYYDDTYTFAVEAAGQNVGGSSDTFHFARRTLIGDGEMVARVAAMGGQDGSAAYSLAKAGVMFRAGTGATARNVFLAISGGNGAVWQSRSSTGGNTDETWSSGKAAPYYIKVKRLGDAFTGYTSTDGSTWTQIGSTVTISGIGSSLEVGMALSAAGYGSLNTTTFDHVTMVPAVPVLTATAVNAHRIDLAWTDNSGSESGFILQRSDNGGASWTQVPSGDIHASGYINDTDVAANTTYQYRVKSFIDDIVRGETAWSAVASASTPEAPAPSTTLSLNPITTTAASEDGRYSADFTLSRSDLDSLDVVAFSLYGTGSYPASGSDMTLTGDGVDNNLHTITFPTGERYMTIHVAAVDDDLLEPDETAQLDLFDPSDTNTSLVSASALIQSDENELWVSGGGLMSEDGGNLQFVIHRENLSGTAHQAYTVNVRLKVAGTDEDTATLDDYGFDSLPGDSHSDGNSMWTSVTFAPDQTEQTFNVHATNDSLVEPVEWFKLVLLDAGVTESGNWTLPVLSSTLPTQAFGGIADDDAAGYHPYHVWITGPSELLVEGGEATYTVHRQRDHAALTQPYEMNVSVEASGFNAVAGTDYSLMPEAFFTANFSMSVHFDTDQDESTFTVQSIDNDVADSARHVTFSLQDGAAEYGSYYITPGDTAHPDAVMMDMANNDAPAAPTNVGAHVFSDTRIDVTWTDNSADEAGFIIKACSPSMEWTVLGTVGANVTSFEATGLNANTTYQFAVESHVDGDNGGPLDSPATNRPSSTTKVEPAAPGQLVNLGTWVFNADGSPVEGQPDLPMLEAGATYRLTASSSVNGLDSVLLKPGSDTSSGGGGNDPTYYGDAEYAWSSDGGDPESDHAGVDAGLKVISGVSSVFATWGDFSSDHTYSRDVTGIGDQLAMGFQDDDLTDNLGRVLLTINEVIPEVSVRTTEEAASEDGTRDGILMTTFRNLEVVTPLCARTQNQRCRTSCLTIQ